mmetsp:Transcript_483/g.934  ORF Transcript_483/g.934 Transcript_483/m.934 type:complete len:257 (-) Transcript_483:447-1217(-)
MVVARTWRPTIKTSLKVVERIAAHSRIRIGILRVILTKTSSTVETSPKGTSTISAASCIRIHRVIISKTRPTIETSSEAIATIGVTRCIRSRFCTGILSGDRTSPKVIMKAAKSWIQKRIARMSVTRTWLRGRTSPATIATITAVRCIRSKRTIVTRTCPTVQSSPATIAASTAVGHIQRPRAVTRPVHLRVIPAGCVHMFWIDIATIRYVQRHPSSTTALVAIVGAAGAWLIQTVFGTAPLVIVLDVIVPIHALP